MTKVDSKARIVVVEKGKDGVEHARPHDANAKVTHGFGPDKKTPIYIQSPVTVDPQSPQAFQRLGSRQAVLQEGRYVMVGSGQVPYGSVTREVRSFAEFQRLNSNHEGTRFFVQDHALGNIKEGRTRRSAVYAKPDFISKPLLSVNQVDGNRGIVATSLVTPKNQAAADRLLSQGYVAIRYEGGKNAKGDPIHYVGLVSPEDFKNLEKYSPGKYVPLSESAAKKAMAKIQYESKAKAAEGLVRTMDQADRLLATK